MNDLRKASEMALNYFESAYELDSHEIEIREALRQALAQPVDAVNISQECVDETAKCKREWVGLTDKELSTLSVSAGIISWSKHDYLADKKQFRELPIDEGMDGDKVCLMQFAQLIEAKLKEKNT